MDLLVLFATNEEIPVAILFGNGVDRWKTHLAEMASKIAGSEELLNRVRDFVS